MVRPSHKIIPPMMGMIALLLGLYFLVRLHLDSFPVGINPYWEYFWLNWQIMLIAGCWTTAYGLLRPRPWGWFFAQLMIVVFYFGYVYLKMVLLGWDGLETFFLLHYTLIAAGIVFFQHPAIRARFITSHTKPKQPRRILKNVTLTILFVGLALMVTSALVAQNFPKIKTVHIEGARTPLKFVSFRLPTGYLITLPEGTRMLDTFRVFLDSEAIKSQRQNQLKQGFIHFNFSTRALVLLTPDGTQVYLQDGTYVQKLLDSLSAASYFHHLGYNPNDLDLGFKWFRERMGLIFVVERGLELDFQFRRRSQSASQHIVQNSLQLFTEAYQVRNNNSTRKVQLFHVYRQDRAAGGGMFTGPTHAAFTDLLASITSTSTEHPSADEYFQQGVRALQEERPIEAGLALGSALFLSDANPRYHYMFARYLLTWPGGVNDDVFHRIVHHLQETLSLDPSFEPALQLARDLGLNVQIKNPSSG